MSLFDTTLWIKMITKLKDCVLAYMENINEELISDINVKSEIDGYLEKLSNISKLKLKSDSINDIIETIFKIDNMTSAISKVIELVTNLSYIKSIQRSMSETYYENILKENKSLLKSRDKLHKWVDDSIDKVIEESINMLGKISIKDTYKIYSKNITANTTKLLTSILKEFRKRGNDISEVIEVMKDNVLGYDGKKFSKKPYCDHPILLMGLTFNLYAPNPKDTLKANDISGSYVTVDNSLINATSTTIYDLHNILFGSYRKIYKLHSINKQVVDACSSIKMIPKLIKQKNLGIKEMTKKDDIFTTIYQSMDGSNYYTTKPVLTTDIAKNINIGPKPRVYLYNAKSMEVLEGKKKDIFLNKIPILTNKYIDVKKWRNIKTVSDVLKEIGYNTKSKESSIYSMVIAYKLLNSYKKGKIKVSSENDSQKIDREDYLIKELI